MAVRLNNPEMQAKIDRWVAETGRGPDELIEDAMAGYFEELAQTREMLNSRYDDLKSGRVKPVPGDEVSARLREKSAVRRSQPGSLRNVPYAVILPPPPNCGRKRTVRGG
jgi:hypothetical protein